MNKAMKERITRLKALLPEGYDIEYCETEREHQICPGYSLFDTPHS